MVNEILMNRYGNIGGHQCEEDKMRTLKTIHNGDFVREIHE